METESMKRLVMLLGLAWTLVLAADGCTDRKVAPGKDCLVNTDCDSASTLSQRHPRRPARTPAGWEGWWGLLT
jgi:hypothetical protein